MWRAEIGDHLDEKLWRHMYVIKQMLPTTFEKINQISSKLAREDKRAYMLYWNSSKQLCIFRIKKRKDWKLVWKALQETQGWTVSRKRNKPHRKLTVQGRKSWEKEEKCSTEDRKFSHVPEKPQIYRKEWFPSDCTLYVVKVSYYDLMNQTKIIKKNRHFSWTI